MRFISISVTGLLLGLAAAQQCGGHNGACPRGNCCSTWGWCGITNEYCGSGCQPNFGTCSGGSSNKPSSTVSHGASPSATSGLKVSTNGECGVANGRTCLGSDEGDCCSQYSYCGKTSAYCGKGCQKGFGSCDGSSSSSFVNHSSSSSSSRAKSSSSRSSSMRTSSSRTSHHSNSPSRTSSSSTSSASSSSSSIEPSSSTSSSSSSTTSSLSTESSSSTTSSSSAPACTTPLTIEQLCEQGVPAFFEYRGFFLFCNQAFNPVNTAELSTVPQDSTEACLDSCILLVNSNPECNFAQYDTTTGLCTLATTNGDTPPAEGVIVLSYSGDPIPPPPVNSCSSSSSSSTSSSTTSSTSAEVTV